MASVFWAPVGTIAKTFYQPLMSIGVNYCRLRLPTDSVFKESSPMIGDYSAL